MIMMVRIKWVACVLMMLALCACMSSDIVPGPDRALLSGSSQDRKLVLVPWRVDFFGQYHIEHSFTIGARSGYCYRKSPEGTVRFVTITYPDGNTGPGQIIKPSYEKTAPRTKDEYNTMIGFPYSEVIVLANGDTREIRWAAFSDNMCFVKFAGGNSFTLYIRSTTHESIEHIVERVNFMLGDPNRPDHSIALTQIPETRQIGGNAWIVYSTRKTSLENSGTGTEQWMTPIADSGYYLHLTFSFVNGQRDANTKDYQRARHFFDEIIRSVVITRQESDLHIEGELGQRDSQ